MLPRNVKRFAWIWLTSILLAFPAILLTPLWMVQHARMAGIWSGEVKVMVGVVLLTVAVLLPFFQQAVWGRKNWARWVLLLAFVIPMPLLFERNMFREDYLPQTLYMFAATLFEAVGFYFLFTGDARDWFRPQTSNNARPQPAPP